MKTETHKVGKYLLFFPLLFTLLFGAAFGGVGPPHRGIQAELVPVPTWAHRSSLGFAGMGTVGLATTNRCNPSLI